jgi:hypothetical protein
MSIVAARDVPVSALPELLLAMRTSGALNGAAPCARAVDVSARTAAVESAHAKTLKDMTASGSD